jgi:hypothetical protein
MRNIELTGIQRRDDLNGYGDLNVTADHSAAKAARLAGLASYQTLDTSPEPVFEARA